MDQELCSFTGTCEFRYKCSCHGQSYLFCKTAYQVGGLFFVDKLTHPNCIAKTFFGDAHICLCPAKNSNF